MPRFVEVRNVVRLSVEIVTLSVVLATVDVFLWCLVVLCVGLFRGITGGSYVLD